MAVITMQSSGRDNTPAPPFVGHRLTYFFLSFMIYLCYDNRHTRTSFIFSFRISLHFKCLFRSTYCSFGCFPGGVSTYSKKSITLPCTQERGKLHTTILLCCRDVKYENPGVVTGMLRGTVFYFRDRKLQVRGHLLSDCRKKDNRQIERRGSCSRKI